MLTIIVHIQCNLSFIMLSKRGNEVLQTSVNMQHPNFYVNCGYDRTCCSQDGAYYSTAIVNFLYFISLT